MMNVSKTHDASSRFTEVIGTELFTGSYKYDNIDRELKEEDSRLSLSRGNGRVFLTGDMLIDKTEHGTNLRFWQCIPGRTLNTHKGPGRLIGCLRTGDRVVVVGTIRNDRHLPMLYSDPTDVTAPVTSTRQSLCVALLVLSHRLGLGWIELIVPRNIGRLGLTLVSMIDEVD